MLAALASSIIVQTPLIAAVWGIIVKRAGIALLHVLVGSACVPGLWMIVGQWVVWIRRPVPPIAGPVLMTVEKIVEPAAIQWRPAKAVAAAVPVIPQI